MKNVKAKFDSLILRPEFFPKQIALIFSTLLVGYAPSSIALGILTAFSIYYTVSVKKKEIVIQKELLWPVFIYSLFALTLLWTVNNSLTFKGLGRTVVLIVLPIAFTLIPKFTLKQTNLVLEYFTKANLAFGLFFVLNGVINYTQSKSLSVFTYHELVSVLDLNAIYVSTFFLISFTYLVSKQNKSRFDVISILFILGLIILLSSKMIFLVLIILFFSYIFFNKKKTYSNSSKSLFAILIAIAIVAITSWQVINRFIEEKTTNVEEIITSDKFGKVYPWTGTSIRLLQARIFYEQLEEDSIFWKGFGLFASRENVKKRHLEYNTYFVFHQYNYHNQYIQIFSEAGIFGLIILIIMLIINFIKAKKSRHFVFISFSIVIPLLFFSESFLWVHRGVLFFTLFYCLMHRTNFNVQPEKKE